MIEMFRGLKGKKIVSLILFLIYLGCILLYGQNTPRSYVAVKASDTLHIDGKASEASWEQASWTADFIDIEGVKTPTYRTRVKMMWDERYFYIYAELEEPHVWATLKQRDTVIFYNNDFEVFIDPDGDTHNYYELELNAFNTVWDLFLTKPYRNKTTVIDSWDIQGLQSAVSIDGTLNDASDQDGGWQVELAIPWGVITEASKSTKPPKNEFWRVNFSRVNWDFDLNNGAYSRKKDAAGKYLPEYNWVWSPQGVIAMHEPEKWGYVYFSQETTAPLKTFEIPKEEHIKWYLYELYRNTIADTDKVAWKTADGQIFGNSKSFFGKTVIPILEKHKTGFLIYVKSPFSQKILGIKDDGKFISYEEK